MLSALRGPALRSKNCCVKPLIHSRDQRLFPRLGRRESPLLMGNHSQRSCRCPDPNGIFPPRWNTAESKGEPIANGQSLATVQPVPRPKWDLSIAMEGSSRPLMEASRTFRTEPSVCWGPTSRGLSSGGLSSWSSVHSLSVHLPTGEVRIQVDWSSAASAHHQTHA